MMVYATSLTKEAATAATDSLSGTIGANNDCEGLVKLNHMTLFFGCLAWLKRANPAKK